MANRRFEIYQYRQVLTRMRLDESDRAIPARSGLMGRQKARALREAAGREGCLDASARSTTPNDPFSNTSRGGTIHIGDIQRRDTTRP